MTDLDMRFVGGIWYDSFLDDALRSSSYNWTMRNINYDNVGFRFIIKDDCDEI